MNEGYSQKTIEGALAARIMEASSMLHIGGNLSSGEPIKIAQMLVQEYPTSSLEDFTLMLQRGIIGRYGKVYGFDISVVFGWMGIFMEEWAEEKERQLAKLKVPIYEHPDLPPHAMPEVDKMLDDLKESLRESKVKAVPSLTRKEIYQEGQSEPPKRKASAYMPDPEKIILHHKKMEWIKECVESDGGDGWRLKDGKLSFEEWIKTDKQ